MVGRALAWCMGKQCSGEVERVLNTLGRSGGHVILSFSSHPAVLNMLFTRHLLTADECSEVVKDGTWMWEGHLAQVVSTKPAGVVQEACQMLEKHGSPVKELKSKLYYSSTLLQSKSAFTPTRFI